MKRHTGGRTIDGISVLVDGEPLSPHADQLKLTDYGSNGAMRAPSLRSWPSRSCSTISVTPPRQRASTRASCSGSSPISNNAENDERHSVFALGAGAFVIAALAVLILGEETKGRTLEHISH